MTSRLRNPLLAIAATIAMACGAYALAGGSGEDGAPAEGSPAPAGAVSQGAARDRSPGGARVHRERGLEALAERLGVEPSDVRAALRDLHRDRHRGEDHRDRFAAALARALDLPPDRVTAALDRLRERRGHGGGPGRQGHGRKAGELARALGVEEERVRRALGRLREQNHGGRGQRRDELAEALAERLGIPPARVKDALADLGPRRGPGGRHRHP
jgi:DNA-binding transcriptional ArsR family regulator